jgi:dihydrofolate synthase / folylpolyglutamate synthase
MLDRLFALERFGIKLGLANITALCEALGHPERAFASLHVGGTNGKGSVTAMVHAALRAAGVDAARYTSPHLVDLNERFVIGDAPVADVDLESAAAHVLDRADALVASGRLPAPPTFFEATTAIAFELFRRAGVRIAVLEVGLGGRFDATNVVHPMAAAITSIGLDHQQHLGGTLESIAREKAGIIKHGVPVVAGALPPDAWPVVVQAAAERKARLVRALEESRVTVRVDNERAGIEIATPDHHYGPMTLALRGAHQIQNAVVAVRLLEEARAAGVAVTFEAIERGLSRVVWPARLEVLVFANGRELLLDSAHNRDGAVSLARFLGRHRRERPPLVFAAMRDKDVEEILQPLLPVVGPVVVTTAPSPRASAPEELARVVRALDASRLVAVEPDPVRAVEWAWTQAPMACVAGSIFLAGAVRGALHRRAIVSSSP